jgi:hypothetical protein
MPGQESRMQRKQMEMEEYININFLFKTKYQDVLESCFPIGELHFGHLPAWTLTLPFHPHPHWTS